MSAFRLKDLSFGMNFISFPIVYRDHTFVLQGLLLNSPDSGLKHHNFPLPHSAEHQPSHTLLSTGSQLMPTPAYEGRIGFPYEWPELLDQFQDTQRIGENIVGQIQRLSLNPSAVK